MNKKTYLFLNPLLVFLCMVCVHTSGKAQTVGVDARIKFYKDFIQQPNLSNSIKLETYDSLLKLYRIQGNFENFVFLRIEKATLLNKTGKYLESFIESKGAVKNIDSLKLDKKPAFERKRMDCLYDMARMSLNLGVYDQSVRYLLDLLSYSNDANYHIRAYSLLSLLFINMDKPMYAENYMNQATKLMGSHSKEIDSLSMFIFYNHYGGLFYAKKQYNAAINELEKAETLAKTFKNPDYLLAVYLNLSNIYLDLDERDLSRNYLLNILNLCKDETSYLHALAIQNIAYLYALDKQFSVSLQYYQKALQVAREIDAKKLLGAICLEMSDVYKEVNDYKKAWEYQRQGYLLKDSVMNAKALEDIMIRTSNFEQRQDKLDKQILTESLVITTLKNRNKTIVLWALFLALSILIISLFIILRRLFRQERSNQNLHQTISSIADTTQKEVSNTAQKLNQDIELKNRKLVTTSLMLVKSNEMVSVLKNDVKKMKAMHQNTTCKEILDEMDSILKTHSMDQNWEEFKLYFEQIHPDFFTILNTICPELSNGEQRTCALIYLNLNAKEIASITHRSVRTVETVMYQIRKKLNIPKEEKILPFLLLLFGKEFAKKTGERNSPLL